jgi:hypothetical protein
VTFPYEDWRYRYIEGIGNDIRMEFVDRARTDEYHMTMDPQEKESSIHSGAAAVFASEGEPRVTILVMPGRTLRITIPINPGAAQFNEFTRITKPSGLPAGTQEFRGNLCSNSPVTGCLEQPLYQIEWKPLEPGPYTLTTVVKDFPSGAVHTYAVAFTVK